MLGAKDSVFAKTWLAGFKAEVYPNIENFSKEWNRDKRKIKSEDREEHLSNMKLVVCSAIKASHEDQNYLNS